MLQKSYSGKMIVKNCMYLWIFQKKHYFSIIIEYGILIFEIHITSSLNTTKESMYKAIIFLPSHLIIHTTYKLSLNSLWCQVSRSNMMSLTPWIFLSPNKVLSFLTSRPAWSGIGSSEYPHYISNSRVISGFMRHSSENHFWTCCHDEKF